LAAAGVEEEVAEPWMLVWTQQNTGGSFSTDSIQFQSAIEYIRYFAEMRQAQLEVLLLEKKFQLKAVVVVESQPRRANVFGSFFKKNRFQN
jgi:hypothetical protein